MRRREFVFAATAASAASISPGCIGGSGPSEQEWETVKGFVREGTELLETAHDRFSSWRDDPSAVSADEFRDVAAALDDPEAGPLPPRDEVRSWEFDVTRDDESWRVDGDDLDEALGDLTGTMTDTRELCEDIASADADPDSVTEQQMSELDRLIEEIPEVNQRIRGLLFGE